MKALSKQRHENVGQVLGLPRSSMEWEEVSKVIRDQNLQGLECLVKSSNFS